MKYCKRLFVLCLIIFLLFLPNLAQQDTDYSEFTKKEESEHFIFYYCPGDEVDVESQECFYRYIVKLFKIKPIDGERMTYWKFRNPAHLKQKTGLENVGGLAYRFQKMIKSTYFWENHELIHILQFNYFNWSTSFFNEGLAMAFQVDPLKKRYVPYVKFTAEEMPLNQYLKIKIEEKKYIKLEKIITTEGFEVCQEEDELIAYVEAGSFARYLIDKYGLKKFFQFLKITHEYDWPSTIRENLIKIYKLPLETLEKQWLDYLEDWDE